jgi:hypothetical protein
LLVIVGHAVAQIRAAALLGFVSHSRAVWSPLALATVCPSGLKATE